MRSKNNWVEGVVIVLISTLSTAIFLEGVYSLWNYNSNHQALTFELFKYLGGTSGVNPGGTSQNGTEQESYTGVLSDSTELEVLLPLFKENGIGMGNTPFREVIKAKASINTTDSCFRQKANIQKTIHQLRSTLFNQLDPITVFYDTGKQLPQKVQDFITRYSYRYVIHTTNAQGERLTLPAVQRQRIAIIAGDSVANGAMVNDADTLASQLQSRDDSRQYISLGVGGASAKDSICILSEAARRYHDRIDELIYVYSENDLDSRKQFGTPKEVISWIEKYASENSIKHTTVIYSPYIYNIVPSITRIQGRARSTHENEREQLIDYTARAGFRYIDLGAIAHDEIITQDTIFAALSLYVDHAHLSRLGTRKLADTLLDRAKW